MKQQIYITPRSFGDGSPYNLTHISDMVNALKKDFPGDEVKLDYSKLSVEDEILIIANYYIKEELLTLIHTIYNTYDNLCDVEEDDEHYEMFVDKIKTLWKMICYGQLEGLDYLLIVNPELFKKFIREELKKSFSTCSWGLEKVIVGAISIWDTVSEMDYESMYKYLFRFIEEGLLPINILDK